MIPNSDEEVDDELDADFEEESEPTLTYRMDLVNQVIIGKCNGVEAMKQAIIKRLNTELYDDIIYEIYGMETNDLIGEDIPYVVSEIKSRITEALLDDDRIEEITDFEFQMGKNMLSVSFTVTTTEGEIAIDEGVEVNV